MIKDKLVKWLTAKKVRLALLAGLLFGVATVLPPELGDQLLDAVLPHLGL